jgi:hypothetical protein
MKQLHSTDYVLYDEANDHVIQFSNGDVVIYSSKVEAEEDCRGNENVVSCTDLPKNWKQVIINQLNKQHE